MAGEREEGREREQCGGEWRSWRERNREDGRKGVFGGHTQIYNWNDTTGM